MSISLTGCIDAKVDVHVASMTTAKVVVTQVMGHVIDGAADLPEEIYAVVRV